MNGETRQLLVRWQALEGKDGLRRAALTVRILWLVGLGLAMFVALAVACRLHPAFVAVGAAVMGWTIAERNASRTRLAQWPIFIHYVADIAGTEDRRKELLAGKKPSEPLS